MACHPGAVETGAGEQQWGSRWAWFGTTVGSTCWLAIAAAVLLAGGHALVALAFALCFLTPCAVAVRAWRRRPGADMNRALETWFVVAWLSTVAALAVSHLTDTHADINLPGAQIWWMWAGVLVGGPLFWLTIRRRRRGADGIAGGLFGLFTSWF